MARDDIDDMLERELLSGDYDGEEEDLGYATLERTQIGSGGRRRGAQGGRSRGGNLDPSKLPRLFCGIKPQVILPGTTRTIQVQVTNPFRPERFVLATQSQGLLIEDIKISRISQNTGDGPVPGSAFGPEAIGTNLRGDTAQTGVGIEITVMHPGNGESPPITLYGAFFGPAA